MALGDQGDPFLIKENDTRPRLPYYLQQGPEGSKIAIPLTEATSAVFNMRSQSDPGDVVISRATAEIVSPASAGLLRYTFTAVDTATPGFYVGEFEVTFSDGGILTMPTGDNWIYIRVGDDIA